ncbi:hypothetical protein LS73_002610 [Helicobacter muridarum]|uniref:Uncharacterized protein n=1 Tax=Helicobacter muridarum TaxID=216 RepID=A0A099U278_9HELI|nr:hypothetical protein [Helicobacter muridarum]TLE01179.1 hypothetical protein LS73_002610 [Helicobacter muridarum]STQ86055.1 Uncharacterised protein [Helicobacter muridarum]
MIQPAHLQNLISQIATASSNREINATLPILLRVLSKQSDNKYLVQLGKLVVETSSNKELTPGINYWANVRQGKDGIVISDLIKQPMILDQLESSHVKLHTRDLRELFNEAKASGKQVESLFKEFLLDRLPVANTRQEFLELSNLLIALQNGVFSMVIQDDNGRDRLVQVKKQVDFLEFYSVFWHLGEISGLVMLSDLRLSARLCVMSDKVKSVLEKHLQDLKGFDEILIDIGSNAPLWDLGNFNTPYMLDLRG